MIVVEEISYSIQDIINQIRESFGFSYVKDTDHSGYILLGGKVRLNLEFHQDNKELVSAVLTLPKKEIDYVKDQSTLEIYSSSIESTIQIIDLINRMLGSEEDKEDDK